MRANHLPHICIAALETLAIAAPAKVGVAMPVRADGMPRPSSTHLLLSLLTGRTLQERHERGQIDTLDVNRQNHARLGQVWGVGS
jgi:hypothetical protein